MPSVVDTPVIVQLSHPYALRWSYGAQARLGSLPRPPVFADLSRPRKSFYALSAYLWASMVDRNVFEGPEDVAEELTQDRLSGALKALVDAVTQSMPADKESDAKKN